MQRSNEESSSPPLLQLQTTLPILAPRDISGNLAPSSIVPSQDQSPDTPVRRARLSHRSRAGCWTCRGRKVKCDEQHPRCGPCTRLNRECDWQHRWSFNNVTSDTQQKHTQILTVGNAVWDATARSTPSGSESPVKADDLPPFRVLTNDEDRERLAGATAPGTYAVVVTPSSFESLPEYGGNVSSPVERRSSTRSGYGRGSPFSTRRPTRDPNVVFLDRFEEASGPPMASPPSTSPVRRASMPVTMHETPEYTSPIQRSATLPAVPPITSEDSRLVICFRTHTVYRIVPRVFDIDELGLTQLSMRNVFEVQATRFAPLYHAICALGALNLYYSNQARLETAAQHYQSALKQGDDTLWSDGSLLRHFLLLLYDISIDAPDNDEARMWAGHLGALKRIVAERSRLSNTEPLAYFIWLVCNLDMQASLLGNGDCSFFCDLIDANQTPHITQQIAQHLNSSSVPTEMLAVLKLNEAVVLATAKMAKTAHMMREAFNQHADKPALLPQLQPQIRFIQELLSEVWTRHCPPGFEPVNEHTSQGLPPRARAIFDSALTLFHAAVIYARTSMFPGQRFLSSHHSHIDDTEVRVDIILGVAEGHLARQAHDQRSIVFPIFMAGVVTRQPDSKIRAMDLLKAFEGSGIGCNTMSTRKLLAAICEEQSQQLSAGGRMEEVDWLQISMGRGMRISNCGL